MINNQDERLERAVLSLDGLAIGNALGEMYSYQPAQLGWAVREGKLPPQWWQRTDDTEMAIVIIEVLRQLGTIDQEALARRFAERHSLDPYRGYGAGVRQILRAIEDGQSWEVVSRNMFDDMTVIEESDDRPDKLPPIPRR